MIFDLVCRAMRAEGPLLAKNLCERPALPQATIEE
jgi:hypothetical protein